MTQFEKNRKFGSPYILVVFRRLTYEKSLILSQLCDTNFGFGIPDYLMVLRSVEYSKHLGGKSLKNRCFLENIKISKNMSEIEKKKLEIQSIDLGERFETQSFFGSL